MQLQGYNILKLNKDNFNPFLKKYITPRYELKYKYSIYQIYLRKHEMIKQVSQMIELN